jgi:hypothetical protein
LTGPQAAFPDGKGLSQNQIKDGTSNTALVTEACGQQIIWTERRDIEVTDESIGVNFPNVSKYRSPAILSSYHRGGAHLFLADGSVRFISDQVDPTVLRALTTASGNDPVGEY